MSSSSSPPDDSENRLTPAGGTPTLAQIASAIESNAHSLPFALLETRATATGVCVTVEQGSLAEKEVIEAVLALAKQTAGASDFSVEVTVAAPEPKVTELARLYAEHFQGMRCELVKTGEGGRRIEGVAEVAHPTQGEKFVFGMNETREFFTTPIKEIVSVSAKTIVFTTENSTYRLERK